MEYLVKVISISEVYLMSEPVDTVRKMFQKIVTLYVDTERPLIIITGSIGVQYEESAQVKEAVAVLEKHQIGFIRITSSLFDDFSLFTYKN
jgi:hypothetical protein